DPNGTQVTLSQPANADGKAMALTFNNKSITISKQTRSSKAGDNLTFGDGVIDFEGFAAVQVKLGYAQAHFTVNNTITGMTVVAGSVNTTGTINGTKGVTGVANVGDL